MTFTTTVFTDTFDINGSCFTWTFYPHSPIYFGVIVLEDADGSVSSATPVINRGDHVLLTVNTSQCFGGIGTRADVTGMVIPEEGSPGVISFTTPSAYSKNIVDLQ